MRHFGALPLGCSGLLCKHAIEVEYVQGDRNQRPSLKPISTAVAFFEWRYGAAALAISSRRRGSAFLLRIKGERTTDTCTGHRAGDASHRGCGAYDKRQEGIGGGGLLHPYPNERLAVT